MNEMGTVVLNIIFALVQYLLTVFIMPG